MINLEWAQFKAAVDAQELPIQFTQNGPLYILLANDYQCKLYSTHGDFADFNANYLPDANHPIGHLVKKVFNSEALADGVFEDSLTVICVFSNKTYNVKNKHGTNGLKFKIWGSPDNSSWEEIVGETIVAAGAKVSVANNDFWQFTKIAAQGDGGASTIDAFIQVGA